VAGFWNTFIPHKKSNTVKICLLLAISSLFIVVRPCAQVTIKEDKKLSVELDKIFAPKFPPSAPGCAVLVARKGEVIYRKAFGMANLELNVPMRPDNVFRIASLTKQFTAVAILQLSEKGLLSVDDDIKKFIPDFRSTERITIANLLSHTSGIKNITETEYMNEARRKNSSPAELVAMIKKLPSDFPPGTAFRYSNSGYLLLGYIIEKVSGKSYEEYIAENIFKPLHMDRAYYDHAQQVVPGRASGYSAISETQFVNADFLDQSFPYSAGALMMSVDDMYKWHKGLYGYTIVKRETLEKAHAPFVLADGKKTSYGFGWGLREVMGSPVRQHGGGIDGFNTFVIYLPNEDVFTVAFSNNMSGNTAGPSMLATMVAANKATAIKISEVAMDKYVGDYQFANDASQKVKIYKENGSLFLKDNHSPVAWRMFFTTDKSFYCHEVFPNNHLFMLDETGKVDGFAIQVDGMDVKVNRVR
jgi:CubicO group peptidase (beta-lactamase class C family)